jgi:hypothetical protein
MFAGAALLLLALAGWSFPAEAQERQRDFTLEASPVGGALGYARGNAGDRLLGVELGFRAPQFDHTFTPATDPSTGSPDFVEILHLAFFVRSRRSERFEVDAGVRGSVATLWDCTASDCWPALFGGAYVQPMVGWERVKVGARLAAGWIREVPEGQPEGSTWTVWMTPFLVRVNLF